MSNIKKILALAFCVALACLVLAGCKSQEPAVEEQQMPEASEVKASGGETEPFYVLVVGNDSRTGTTQIDLEQYADGLGRSDTCMLVRVDPKTYDICIITVPRDTAANVNGSKNKINDSYRQGGIKDLTAQVTELTGVTPKYYLDMGFVNFEQFIDGVDSVDVNVPVEVALKDIVNGGKKITLEPGEQTLDGVKALVFCRARHEYEMDQDACRQIQDRQVVEKVIRKVLADPSNTSKYTGALEKFADTNWDSAGLEATVQNFVKNADKVVIRSGTGPYAGGDDAEAGMWLTTRDTETWKKVIEAAENNGDLNSVVPLPM